jgi:hypothetical protein
LPLLQQILAQTDSRLLIFDPFVAYLGSGVDSCNDQDVRRCLHRLARLADRARCAIVLLRHLNKVATGKALYRGGGSIGIIGAARAGLLVGADPDSPERRILASTKSNLCPVPTSLAFLLEPAAGDVCRVRWCGPAAQEADDLIRPFEERAALEEAVAFLRSILADGPVAAEACLRQARSAGLSERTLRRAKGRLRIRSIREGQGPRPCWLWRLPRK